MMTTDLQLWGALETLRARIEALEERVKALEPSEAGMATADELPDVEDDEALG